MSDEHAPTPPHTISTARRLTLGIIGTVLGLATMGSVLAWMIYTQQPRTTLPAGTELPADKIEAMQRLAETDPKITDEAIRRYVANPRQPATEPGK